MPREEKDTHGARAFVEATEVLAVRHPCVIDVDVIAITVEEAASRILDRIGTVR